MYSTYLLSTFHVAHVIRYTRPSSPYVASFFLIAITRGRGRPGNEATSTVPSPPPQRKNVTFLLRINTIILNVSMLEDTVFICRCSLEAFILWRM